MCTFVHEQADNTADSVPCDRLPFTVSNHGVRLQGSATSDSGQGRTTVYLADGDGVIAAFLVADRLKPGARALVDKLKAMGLSPVMVSGDQEEVVARIAARAGITAHRSRTLPTEKADFVTNQRNQGKTVAMVGDGINDAPALTAADVGIAVARGTDIAMESADIVLMREDLGLVAETFLLSRRIFSTIRYNLFWAFGYNLTALPLAFFGLLHPIVCAGAMAASSLCVVGNSLLLRQSGRRRSA